MNRQGNESSPFCLQAPLEKGYYSSFTQHGSIEAVRALAESRSSFVLSPQGRLCVRVHGADRHQREASCELGYPIRAVYAMHCLQPLGRSDTSIRACHVMLQHRLHNTQALIVRHQLWDMCYMRQCCGHAPVWCSSDIAQQAVFLNQNVMECCVREEMLYAIAVGEVCDDYRHAVLATPEMHKQEVAKFRVRCIIVLENMPVILSTGPVTLLSTYNRLLGRRFTFDAVNLLLTLLASVGRKDLVDRFILQHCRVLPLPVPKVAMEDACFEALSHVPDTVLAPCMRDAIVHTGRGKRTWRAWRAAIVKHFVRVHMEGVMIAFCFGRRSPKSLVHTLPDEIVCAICKMAWQDLERKVRRKMQDGIS